MHIRSIRTKLVVSYFVVTLLTLLFIYGLIRINFGAQLRSLVASQRLSSTQQVAADWYAANGTWEGFTTHLRETNRGPSPPPERERAEGESPLTPPSGFIGVTDADRRALMPMFGVDSGERIGEQLLADALPITVNDAIVGYVVQDNDEVIGLTDDEERFLARTDRVLQLSVVGGLILALLMGLGLSRVLVRPIRALTTAARSMAAGNLKQQVPIESQDELGQLATAFNQMSHDLDAAAQQRRQMTADIAHDLSTPLQVISGYVEAAQDGDLALTPARLNTIAGEIQHLSRLIEDLDLLAKADTQTLSLHLDALDLADFLQHVEMAFAPLAAAESVTLSVAVEEGLTAVSADDERLLQVLGNLIKNALRYTPVGGTIAITAHQQANSIVLQVQDSGSGIDATDLPHIFDRFYRADEARSEGGKMGLGLAISRALIEAMGGTITAKSEGHEQGSTFTITLAGF
ncbi:MAG: ATP-binding protein [Chloroflexota bacterium]